MEAKKIYAQALTDEAFAPFGSVVQQKDDVKMVSANGGTAKKYLKVSESIQNYEKSSSASTSKGVWNFFSTHPSVHPANDEHAAFQISVLERHPFTTQTFIPMCRSSDEQAYLIAVAPNAPDGMPDWNQTQAFVAKGAQGVTYSAGVWHAPMVTIGKETMLAAFNYENGVADDDCQVQSTESPIEVFINNST